MNKIFLVFQNIVFLTILNFYENNNYVYVNNVKYNFEIININKLKLINYLDNKEIILTTNDNILYFENTYENFFIYRINLIYSEFIENLILNFKHKKIYSITTFKEGYFCKNNNELIINWNCQNVVSNINNIIKNYTVIQNHNVINNHNNIFLYYNDNNYIQKNIYNTYISSLQLKKKDYIKKNKVVIFIHVCFTLDGIDIMYDQLNIIEKSNISQYIDQILLCIVGIDELPILKLSEYLKKKVQVLYYYKDTNIYEIKTINEIHNYCINNANPLEEIYILYIHTKGVRKAGNNKVIYSWRKMMEYFLIEKGLLCLNNLYLYDVIGNNIINDYINDKIDSLVHPCHCYHFSGNFWWSKSSYISQLKNIDMQQIQKYIKKNNFNFRYQAENWILSNIKNKPNIGILYQDDSNLHPYHRYIHDIYKNDYIFLKKYSLYY